MVFSVRPRPPPDQAGRVVQFPTRANGPVLSKPFAKTRSFFGNILQASGCVVHYKASLQGKLKLEICIFYVLIFLSGVIEIGECQG